MSEFTSVVYRGVYRARIVQRQLYYQKPTTAWVLLMDAASVELTAGPAGSRTG